LEGDPLSFVEPLLDALRTGVSTTAVGAAAAALRGAQPAALLAHPSLVSTGHGLLEALATTLQVSEDSGMLGAPLLGANARGALEFAPDLFRGDADQTLVSSTLFAVGDNISWDAKGTTYTRLILATSRRLIEDPRIEVVLPMAHAYERQATLTNLEGRVQHQEGGAAAPAHARTDWGIVAGLAQTLGISPAPGGLDSIRSLMAAEYPAFAEVLRQEALVARV
jgi:NADH dehydrogenase/NADH:ubiquinone oxidoreductase subunit G